MCSDSRSGIITSLSGSSSHKHVRVRRTRAVRCLNFRLLAVAVAVLWFAKPPISFAQYDWTPHLGEQQSGFEKYWFGEWDLEVRSLRGMIDWRSYSTPIASDGKEVSKIKRLAYRRNAADSTESLVHSSLSIVRADGRVSSTTYQDPQTGKTLQRELFKYDEEGRLIEWRPVKDPATISHASIARTIYAGTLPVGRVQRFEYYEDGTLKQWMACGDSTRDQDNCRDATIGFDGMGKIVAFSWLKNDYSMTRDDNGRLSFVDITNTVDGYTQRIEIKFDDVVVRERFIDSLNVGRENIVAVGMSGIVRQYRVPSASGSLQYSTTTWTYDDSGRVVGIQKGLESYQFERGTHGEVTGVHHSGSSQGIVRSFDKRGRLVTQSPAIGYNRYDLVENGAERYAYTTSGLLSSILVSSEISDSIARLELDYEYRRTRREPVRQNGDRD